MKAAIALMFLACIAGSMAADARIQFVDQLVQQGQAVAQSILSQVQQQILALAQQAANQVNKLVSALGGRFDIGKDLLNSLVGAVTPHINNLLASVLGQLGNLSSIFGGRGSLDLSSIFGDFYQSISGAISGIGQHFLNQGLSAVLGGLGGLGGSRGAIGDIFASLSQQISGVVSAGQAALQGALGNLAAIGAGVVDATKPHFQQLQESLVGHGLNALGSLSETINNLHGSITGGR